MWSNREGILFCVIGPAGSGKSTIVKKLLEEFPKSLTKSISVTTRTPRTGEQDGVHYHFVSPDEFDLWVSEGRFFEWEETHGNRYGTLRAMLDGAIQQGHDLVFDIDIRGALTLKAAFPHNAVVIFVLAPSEDEMRSRMVGRAAISDEELERRLTTARRELRTLLEKKDTAIDYLLVNDELAKTYDVVLSIVNSERLRASRISEDSVLPFCHVEGRNP